MHTEGTIQVEVECESCKKKNTRYVVTIAPEAFTNSRKPSITSVFWCDHCHATIAVKYKFVRIDGAISIEAKEIKNGKKVYKVKPPSTGITIKPKQKNFKK